MKKRIKLRKIIKYSCFACILAFILLSIFLTYRNEIRKRNDIAPILEIERENNTFEYARHVFLDEDFTVISDAKEILIETVKFEHEGSKSILYTDGSSFILPHQIGKVTITFKATGFNKIENRIEKEYMVVDRIKPEIITEYIFDTTIDNPERNKVLGDVYAYDEIDGVLPVHIDDLLINYDEPGSYMATLYTKDSSNNYSEQSVRVNIHTPDPEEVVILVNNDTIELHPGESINIEECFSIKNSNFYDWGGKTDIMIIEPPMDAKSDPYKKIVEYDKETKTLSYSSPGEAKVWILVTNSYKYYDADIKIVCSE